MQLSLLRGTHAPTADEDVCRHMLTAYQTQNFMHASTRDECYVQCSAPLADLMCVRFRSASCMHACILVGDNSDVNVALTRRQVDGVFPFDTTLLALLIETIKLGASILLLSHEVGGPVQCMNEARLLVHDLCALIVDPARLCIV